MNNKNKSYLPKVRSWYHPSQDAVDSSNGTDKSIHLPNPAVDTITVNNIACNEFDYTDSINEDDIF